MVSSSVLIAKQDYRGSLGRNGDLPRMTHLAEVAFIPYGGTGSYHLRTSLYQAHCYVLTEFIWNLRDKGLCYSHIRDEERLRIRQVKSCVQKPRFFPLPATSLEALVSC